MTKNVRDFLELEFLKVMRIKKIPLGEPAKKVLIIDEINRGNLSKIFGELIYALEYRDEPIDLQYATNLMKNAKRTLKIPDNLYLLSVQ